MELKALQQQENRPSDRKPNRHRRRSSTAPAGRIESDPKGTENVEEIGSSGHHNGIVYYKIKSSELISDCPRIH
jgi:hypothetical protein